MPPSPRPKKPAKSTVQQLLSSYGWPALCGLLGAILLTNYFDALRNPAHNVDSNQLPNAVPNLAQNSATMRSSYADIVAIASPSVVNIYTRRVVKQARHPLLNDPLFNRFLGSDTQRDNVTESLGSGVVVSTKGYILTNNHVISNADEILVRLADGRAQLAEQVGADPETDLAVLKIELDGLVAATFGEPAQPRVGDVVLAIGNPYGYSQSVSQGIVSATGRYGLQLNTYENFIQTDAATNPGNSGGALVNMSGELIGINTAIVGPSGTSQGIALAIPTDIAQHVLQDIVEFGEVIRGWLGIQVQELTPSLAQRFNLRSIEGIVLTKAISSGPADRAGMKSGDIITHIADIRTGSGNSGMHQVAMIRPGTKVNVRIIRAGAAQSLWLEVGKRNSQSGG